MKAFILIEDGVYPVFNLTSKPEEFPGAVAVDITEKTLANWKASATRWQKTQVEMHKAVDFYQPTAVTRQESIDAYQKKMKRALPPKNK